MADRTLTVHVVGDDRSLQRTFSNSQRAAGQFESRMTRLNQTSRGFLSGFGGRSALLFGSGAFIGSAALSSGISKAVTEASALNEEIAKSEQIFRGASPAVQSFAETTARSIGVSRREALEATGVFGNLFNVIGIAPRQSAEMSTALVRLAADMASFNNADPTDMLDRLRAGLVGEAEPLRRFGVFLNEARVQQEALANTGKTTASALTDQEKAIARYNLILKDTAPQQGDVERTSGSLANQTRQLNAQLDDLSANVGQLLIPALTEIVGDMNDFATSLNDAFVEAGKLVGVLRDLKDLSPIEIDIPISMPISILFKQGRGGDLKGGLAALGENIRESLESALSGGAAPFKGLADRLSGEGGPGFQFFPSTPGDVEDPLETLTNKAEDDADKAEKNAARARAARARREKAFDEFVAGMGLKLDKAQLTEGLDDDIAALEELERAVLRRIAREGRTFALVEQLTQVRLQLAGVRSQRAAAAAASAREAYQEIIGTLELRLDQALRTASFEDDLKALDRLENAVRAQIAAEGRTLELLQQLDRIIARREDVLRQQRERRTERRQAGQFQDLGLTAEGDRRTPGAGALLRRANTLEDQIKGTVLDTAANRAKLDRIQSVLTRDFDKLGKNVREAILRMLNEISGALDQGGKLAPDTPGSKFGIEKLIEGLGLSPEQVKELRQRFASLGGPGPTGGAATVDSRLGSGATLGATAGAPSIDLHLTVEIDGQPVEASVTRRQEKKRGRNAPSRRGPQAGRR